MIETNGTKYNIEEKIMNRTQYESILQVANVQKSDYGTYICDAINEIGEDSFPIEFVSEGRFSTQVRLLFE